MDTRIGGRAIAGWVLSSTLAWGVASIAGFVLVGGVVTALWGDPDEVLGGPVGFAAGLGVVFLLAGAAMGAMQGWLLHRRGAAGVARWVLGSALGFAIVAVGFALLEPLLPRLANEVLHNAAAGAVAGVLQARVLLSSGIALRRRTWIGWSCAAYLSAATVNALVARLLGGREDISGIVGVAVLSLVLVEGLRRVGQMQPVTAPSLAVPAP